MELTSLSAERDYQCCITTRTVIEPARSVSRFLYPPKRAATIPLGLPLLTGSSDLPGSCNGAGHSSSPIWSCSTWGFPCQPDCSSRGALLPHHFTLTFDGGIFSVA